MCGISGIYNFNGAPVDLAHLQAMSDALAHRGPDGFGRYLQGPVGLGHRRLSIIDLEGGSQPLANEDDTVHVVFNGEIYNFIELRQSLQQAGHQFKTRSDTEVIVHAYEQWGDDCVSHFNGIFAFALWDQTQQRLFLARDHLGVKPLYYTLVNGQLLFASEIKSLLAHPACPRRVDPAALGQLFTFRYVPSPRTLFAGICKLPPGHSLTLGQGLGSGDGASEIEGESEIALQPKRYWTQLPDHRHHSSEPALQEEYGALVENAVRLQLRSDVPVGLFLSSGVDSAALLAIMRQQSAAPIHTFTIGFEGGERSNENADALALARNFGADHSELIVTAADYENYFERYMGDLEEPVGNETAAAFYFVSRLAASKVKVVLTGQGADEPWAGYHRHWGVQLSEYYRRLPASLTQGLIKNAVMALPRNERLKRGVQSLDEPDVLTRFAKVYSFFTPGMRAQLFNDGVKSDASYRQFEARQALAHLQHDVRALDPVSQMLYIDTRASLPDDLLMVNDKMSMANSIESRVPYLDPRLVEFVESLPLRYKLRFGNGKFLHKKTLQRWLPKTVVHAKKKGFDNPMQQWLRERLRTRVDELLFSSHSAVRNYFDMDYLRRIVKLHQDGRENYMRHIYLLISFEMWHRRFIGGAR
jgi:asparagine synthase (glutamine-hydrolysing)